jgi:flavin reductase (DIM6/NTAB) family NADH-FMN oxidoreductase RutF
MAAAGLESLPFCIVRPPRVKGSPVHFGCRLHQVIGPPRNKPASEHHLVIGRVLAVHIDDAALTADERLDILKLRPIARLGYKDYTAIDCMFQIEKRSPEDNLAPRPRE